MNIFCQYHSRCKKEHGLGRNKGPVSAVDSGMDVDTTLDDSTLNDTVDGTVNGTDNESQTSTVGENIIFIIL